MEDIIIFELEQCDQLNHEVNIIVNHILQLNNDHQFLHKKELSLIVDNIQNILDIIDTMKKEILNGKEPAN